MGDHFASYFVQDTTVCFKFYFPNSFREIEKNGSQKWRWHCLKRAGDFNLRHFSICSPVFECDPYCQSFSTFSRHINVYVCMHVERRHEDAARFDTWPWSNEAILRTQTCNILTYVRAIRELVRHCTCTAASPFRRFLHSVRFQSTLSLPPSHSHWNALGSLSIQPLSLCGYLC